MKFSDPTLQQAICEIRFKPTIKVHNYRFDLVEEFSEIFPYWNVNWRIIELYDNIKKEDSNQMYGLTNQGASLLYKYIQNYEKFDELSNFLIKNTVKKLEIEKFIRYGVRFFYLYGFNGSFNKLRELLINKFYNNKFFTSVEPTSKINDLAYIVVFSQSQINFRINLGPLSKKEIQDMFDKETLMDIALLVDVDCYLEDISSDIITSHLTKSHKGTKYYLEKIENYLGE